jgi:adenosylhomocysteine nucleosidase
VHDWQIRALPVAEKLIRLKGTGFSPYINPSKNQPCFSPRGKGRNRVIRTAIIAAMPGELKFLVRGWPHTRSNGVDLWRSDGCITACAGAGVAAATRAFAEVEKLGPVDQVISTGWAGALTEALKPGQAYRVSGVINARTGERFWVQNVPENSSFACTQKHTHSTERLSSDLWLVTSATVAGHAEKQRLASTTPAALVDMEAAAIAHLAAVRGIPFFCVKGVSDGYKDQLPDFNRFISPGGSFQLARFVFFALLRPRIWPALIRMGENSKKASRAIAVSLLDLLGQ